VYKITDNNGNLLYTRKWIKAGSCRLRLREAGAIARET
jgi:hypothetical protein